MGEWEDSCPACIHGYWEAGIGMMGCEKHVGGIWAIYGLGQLPFPKDCAEFKKKEKTNEYGT